MSGALIIFAYIIFLYGISWMFVFSEGPFYIFERIRDFASSISQNFGKLFSCMFCFPSNVSWIMSLIDWFLIPQVAFTPFNIILAGTGLWWLAVIMDIGFGGGIVWLINVLEEWLEQEPFVPKGNSPKIQEPGFDEEEGYVEISPKIDRKTKKQILND